MGLEHLGAWGLIPPLLTIILAFVTKDVIVSLFLGILSGLLIVAGGNPGLALINTTDLLADALNDGWNIRIFLFCALLGGLVGMLSRTGASGALGVWAGKRLKSPKTTQLTGWFFGLLIFIDDYFNSLTVGTIMRPITDKQKISRAKLAYILDSTAAPVCIIAPISSWVVTVMSVVKKSEGFTKLGVSEFQFFIQSILYNMYAILTLIMVVFIALSGVAGYEGASLLNASMISIAAVLSGAVFGDHASPISDTTILSSTGASCPHLEHVATQMPYAIFVALCSFIGFIVGGIALNAIVGWIVALAVFVGGMMILPKAFRK